MPSLHLVRRAALWLVLCGVARVSSADGPAPEGPAPEGEPLRWALSYGPSQAAPPEGLGALLADSPSDVVERLLGMGEPARRALLRLSATDAALADRVRPWLARLQQVEDAVESSRLDHAMAALLVYGEGGLLRARRILPDGAPGAQLGGSMSPDVLAAWWVASSRAYRWAPAADRFVAWEPWGPDQAPLRFRHRDRVVLRGTEGIVRWDTPVTVEAWVRWAHPTSGQYLLTDEAWPELKPDVLPTPTKRGFALRRNPRGSGLASIDLTLAVAPNHWVSVESGPLAITDDWEHVAATSDGRILRLFRDGELVAARSLGGLTPLPGLGDLSIGAREHALENRVANFDLRALRISEGTRYVEDFVPSQALAADDAALFTPTFVPGGAELGDLSAKTRRHEIVGARFVPALDASAVARALAPFRGEAKVHVFEADRGGRSADWYLAERDAQSEGLNVEIWSEREPDLRGHWVSVPLRVPRDGRYRVHLAGPGLENLGAAGLVSPFSWRIGGSGWTVQATPVPTIRGLGGHSNGPLSPLGTLDLVAGEVPFQLRLLDRRAYDGRYSLWLDAVVLEEVE